MKFFEVIDTMTIGVNHLKRTTRCIAHLRCFVYGKITLNGCSCDANIS